MGKIKIKSLRTILVIILVVWLLFFGGPFVVLLFTQRFSIIELWSVSFSAATALFTGIAFSVAFHSLYKQQESIIAQHENLKIQQESLSKQTELSVFGVFMEAMKNIMYSKSFRKCQDYILSDTFFDDMDLVRMKLKKSKGDEITLDDYSRAIEQGGSSDSERIQLKYSFTRIKDFCMRIESLGIIVLNMNDNTAKKLLLDLYGDTIQKTYRRIGPLVNNEKKELYKHYAQLNNIATEEYKMKKIL